MNAEAEKAANSSEEVIRILVVGRDQLIRSGKRYDVDFIPTGRSTTPDAPLGYAPTLLTKLEYLWSALRGDYRLLLIPAPEPDSRWARLLRPLAAPWVQKLFQRLPLLRAKANAPFKIALLDRNSSTALPESALAALHPDLCWKLNLLESSKLSQLSPEIAPEFVSLCRPLPCWVYPPALGWSRVPWRAKNIDLFVPPGPDSPARRAALQWLERFRKTGKLTIRIASNEIADSDLHEQLSRARIVLSPVGQGGAPSASSASGEGFHSFRHYQAMLHGAVPLINHPPALQTTLVQGENCLFYDETEEALHTLLHWAAEHPESTEILARQARDHAQRYHTPAAVSRALLEAAGLPAEE